MQHQPGRPEHPILGWLARTRALAQCGPHPASVQPWALCPSCEQGWQGECPEAPMLPQGEEAPLTRKGCGPDAGAPPALL